MHLGAEVELDHHRTHPPSFAVEPPRGRAPPPRRVVDEVKSNVDAITTFPIDTEDAFRPPPGRCR